MKRSGHTPACGRFARQRPQRVDAEARRGFAATAANRQKAIELTKNTVMEDSAKPISMIACGEFDAFCDSGDMMPVATITVTKMMM